MSMASHSYPDPAGARYIEAEISNSKTIYLEFGDPGSVEVLHKRGLIR